MRNRNKIWPTSQRPNKATRGSTRYLASFLAPVAFILSYCPTAAYSLGGSAHAQQTTETASLSRLSLSASSAESTEIIRVGEIPDQPIRPATMQATSVQAISQMAVTVSQSALENLAAKTKHQLSSTVEERFQRARQHFLATNNSGQLSANNSTKDKARAEALKRAKLASAAHIKRRQSIGTAETVHEEIDTSLQRGIHNIAALNRLENAPDNGTAANRISGIQVSLILDEQLSNQRLPQIALSLDSSLRQPPSDDNSSAVWRIPMAAGLGQRRPNATQATLQALR